MPISLKFLSILRKDKTLSSLRSYINNTNKCFWFKETTECRTPSMLGNACSVKIFCSYLKRKWNSPNQYSMVINCCHCCHFLIKKIKDVSKHCNLLFKSANQLKKHKAEELNIQKRDGAKNRKKGKPKDGQN